MSRRVIGVSIGEIAAGQGELSLEAYALGSCVGLCLWDQKRKIGGMAHILLPERGDASPTRELIRPNELGKYGDLAIEVLLLTLVHIGATVQELTATVVGGASMFSFGGGNLLGRQVGERNVETVLGHLQRRGIPVVFQDTGGHHGRSIRFDVDTGQVAELIRKEGERSMAFYRPENKSLRTASQLLASVWLRQE